MSWISLYRRIKLKYRMRINLQRIVFVILVSTSIVISLLFWNKCSKEELYKQSHTRYDIYDKIHVQELGTHNFDDSSLVKNPIAVKNDSTKIDCYINGQYTIECLQKNSQVYIPFEFISKYFEISGKISENNGVDRFEWEHSYSTVYRPLVKYETAGFFMSFEHYNVEFRSRVKCITGIEGVPLSTQWGPEGYFYPIQIAQYGLSHYSRYVKQPHSHKRIADDMEKNSDHIWSTSESSRVSNVYDSSKASKVLKFSSPDSFNDEGAHIKLDESKYFHVAFDYKFTTSGSVSVSIITKNLSKFYVHYVSNSTLMSIKGEHIFYGIGLFSNWRHICRSVFTDFSKALKLNKKKRNKSTTFHKILGITLHGNGFIDNLTLSDTADLSYFYYAVNWHVLNQDEKGGWPINVVRILVNGALNLDPGWYSAMGQGHAMSLLSRAYLRTGNKKYLDSALKALYLFHIPSSEGGILANIFDKYPWYEEYPTTPSSCVLNGFIYSLIGLYDLKCVSPPEYLQEVTNVLEQGLQTLYTLLPIFDTGSGSVYDLRHLTLGVAPNLARWDYHATHINQLLLLGTIVDNKLINDTASRWIDYMNGYRAPHN